MELESWLHSLAEQHSLHQGSKDPQTHAYYRQFLTEGANCPPYPLVRVFPEHIDVADAKMNARGGAEDKQAKDKKV